MNEQTIFATALAKKTADDRKAFLDEACGQDTALRAQVEELLAADAGAGSFLEHPPAGLDATIDASLGSKDTVDAGLPSSSLPFLEPCDKPDRIGKLGLYEIIEVVGQGGMGSVLRAVDTKLGRIVAVKVMAPELAANPTAVKRFLREAQSAAAVVHDHVVHIYGVYDESRPPYLVMEFIQGQTLQQKIDREGALELRHILRIGSQMAAGLGAAHKTGLIHRDVKPGNILLENGVERVKITDFGLARAADDVEMTKQGMIAGTPQYMSPEQAHGSQIDFRSDLFSLGSVLYTMCTGRPAFRAETTMGTLRRVTDDTPRPIREVNAEIPEWLEAIVLKLLAKNPDDRFQSAKEVAELLEQHLAHLQQPSQFPRPEPVQRPRKDDMRPAARPKRWRPVVAIAVAVLLTAWATLWFGPAAWLYVTNSCKLTLGIHPDFDEFLVVREDNASTTNVGSASVRHYTQWKVKPGSTLTLSPGKYRIEGLSSQGETVSRWNVQGAGMFMGYSTEANGPQIHADIGRGDRLMLSIAKAEPKPQADHSSTDGWTPLFNGQDLTGWEVQEAYPGDWKVEDGVLVGKNHPDRGLTRLISRRPDFGDFHLRAEVKINDRGNSGIWLRAPADRIDGYEAQINSTHKDPKTGSLLVKRGEVYKWPVKVEQQTPASDTWFLLEMIAVKDKLTVRVDGKTVGEATDATYDRGHLVLEVFEAWTVAAFRKIEIKELPPVETVRQSPALVISGNPTLRKEIDNQSTVRHMVFTLGTSALIAGGDDLRFYDAVTGELLQKEKLPHFVDAPLSLSKDGKTLAVICEKEALIIDLPTRRIPLESKSGYVFSAALTPDGKTLVYGAAEDLHFLDRASGKTQEGAAGVYMCLKCSLDGNYLVATSRTKQLVVFDAKTRSELARKDISAVGLTDISGDSRLVAVSGLKDEKPAVWIYKMPGCELMYEETNLAGGAGSIAFSPDGTYLALGTIGSGKAQILDLMQKKAVATWDANPGGAIYTAVAYSPDGKTLATGGSGGKIKLWDLVKSEAGGVNSAAPGEKWDSLLSGKDLAGWHAVGGTAATWKVENGILRGAGSPSYLVSDKSFSQFVLKAEMRVNPGGEWGILFRTDPAELKNKRPRGLGVAFTFKDSTNDVDGHMRMEVQPAKDGNPLARVIVNVKPNDWFPVKLTVHDDQVEVQISGGGVGASKFGATIPAGPLILRLPNANSALEFRNIEIQELPPATK